MGTSVSPWFEDRLRARDDDKTKKLTERKLTKEEIMEEERRGVHKTAEERDALMPDLRKVSREEYLKKREAQKLDELKDMIEDEKFLFDGVEVTAAEKRDMEYRRKVGRCRLTLPDPR
jgi:pre-mRNA-splicing factor ATP-dependent RNA helicase DHX16